MGTVVEAVRSLTLRALSRWAPCKEVTWMVSGVAVMGLDCEALQDVTQNK